WLIQLVRPGAHPLTTLAAALLGVSASASMQGTIAELGSDPRTLHLASELALAKIRPGARLVWVIDQCEEVFTLCPDGPEREAFIANLVHAGTAPGTRATIILTLRADFYPRAAT